MREVAETGDMQRLLSELGTALDDYLKFEYPDAQADSENWRQ